MFSISLEDIITNCLACSEKKESWKCQSIICIFYRDNAIVSWRFDQYTLKFETLYHYQGFSENLEKFPWSNSWCKNCAVNVGILLRWSRKSDLCTCRIPCFSPSLFLFMPKIFLSFFPVRCHHFKSTVGSFSIVVPERTAERYPFSSSMYRKILPHCLRFCSFFLRDSHFSSVEIKSTSISYVVCTFSIANQ